MLDPAHLGRILPGVGLHGDGEGLARVPGIQAHRHGAARAHTFHPAGRTFDVRRVDVAPGHDDHVLDAAAHDDVALFGDVAEVAGVVPTVLVLGRQEAAH